MLSKPLPTHAREKDVVGVCQSLVGMTLQLQIHATLPSGEQLHITAPDCDSIGRNCETVVVDILKHKIGDEIAKGPPNAFPDATLGKRINLECKCGDGFDLAGFSAFVNDVSSEGGLFNKVFMTRYLIFEYSWNSPTATITSFHYVPIWKAVLYDKIRPLGVQVKAGIWFNIRPCVRSGFGDINKTPGKFIKNLIECINLCPQIQDKDAKIASIEKQFGDICAEYVV
jgi:hypothetical protein